MDRGLILMPKISTTKNCVSVGVKRVKLKYWNTSKEAFAEYKTVKEKIIKEYAVPPGLYLRMQLKIVAK